MEPSGVSLFPLTPSAMLRRVLAVSTIAIVAACQSPAATTTPSTPAATGGQPSAGASTAPTEGPSEGLGGLFHLVGSEPVLPRTTFQDRGAVLPGAITVDAEGTYHAWVIAFGEPAGTQEVHYLTSTDAVAWTEQEDASLAGLSEGLGNPGAMPTSVLETEDGWVMYLVGTLATEQQGWDIWRATADGPGGPWTRSDEPVLARGAEGAWDAGGLDFPSVVATDEGLTMFYAGIPSTETNEGSIGMATSTDGIAWTKADAPVVGPGLCGEFDSRAVLQPRVLNGPNGLYLLYAGYAGEDTSRPGVGFASSTDGGLTWGCQWPANAMNVSELEGGEGIHTVNAFMRGERVALLIEWLAEDGSDVWLAHLGPREP